MIIIDMNDFCHDLEVIPQFTGTCWFNAILMITLYSSGVSRFIREIAIRDNWRKSEDGFKVAFYNILSYINRIRHNPNNKEKRDEINRKLNEYLFKIKPEILLLDLIERKDKKLKEFFISVNKDSSKKINLSLNFIYIISFMKVLNINFIDIYCDLYNNYNVLDMNHDIKTEDEMEEKLNSNPDVIIYTDSFLNSSDYLGEDYEYDEIYDTNTYNLNINDLKKHKEIIKFNGCNYKLDSVLISNYNNEIYKHAIAGITCNNNHYVYNGWNATTNDPGLKQKEGSVLPCSLMKYDWNVRKDEGFCLNTKTCKLDFIDPSFEDKKLCFSFAKDKRLLIYVRVDDEMNNNKISKEDISSKTPELSGVSEMIKNIHNIDTLTKEELREALFENFKLVNLNKYSTSKLRELYYKLLIKNYNLKQSKSKSKPKSKDMKNLYVDKPKDINEIMNKYPHMKNLYTDKPKKVVKEKPLLKKDLIQAILAKYPYMKNLNSKTKDELALILNGKKPEVVPIVKKPLLKKQDLIELVKKQKPHLKGLAKLTKQQLEAILK